MTFWKDSLLVGVPEIDDQHRKLVGMIDSLMQSSKEGKGREAIEETLDFAISYAQEHFKDEERVQAKYSYPGLGKHRQIHKQFVAEVSVLIREFKRDGASVAVFSKLTKTLVDWLINHISNEDKKVGEHIQKVNLRRIG
jgi:hemerythrin